nr:PepSY-associated TM helix domain-containing protein [Desulfobulbaceae bacterium]
MKWRKWNNCLHRDLGYLCFGLTIIYVISGIAVNHIGSWNPNYRIEHIESELDPAGVNRHQGDAQVAYILNQIGESRRIKNSFSPAPDAIKIFVEGNTVTVNLASGKVAQEKAVTRPILHEMNFLHLNHPKKLWTWFADLYALSLGLLALTGLFVLRGKNGITGRGAWLTGVGLLIPVLFLFMYI